MSLRLLHASDFHLGFKQFQRVNSLGINIREADCARTFATFIDRAIALAPDVIVIAGDVFHSVRPSNTTINHAFAQFRRLTTALPQTLVVAISGNHDEPKASESGCILPLFSNLGIHVVTRAAKQLHFPDYDLSILAVPDAPGMVVPDLTPDLGARYNVLLLHGTVRGAKQGGADRRDSESALSIAADEWTYVALGHFHEYEELAPNMYYAGSLDFCSSNPWNEKAPKGFIERNLETGDHRFHELPASRPHVDLEPVDAHGMGAEETSAAIRSALESADGGIDGKVVRLVVRGVSREIGRALDHKMIREFQRRTLNLNLDLRRPDAVVGVAPLEPRRKLQSLADMLGERFGARETPNDIDRAAFVALAQTYLDRGTDPYQEAERLAPVAIPDALAAEVAA